MLKSAVNGGVVLGLFLLSKFVVSILSLQVPFLDFFSLLMLAGVPYILYRLQTDYYAHSQDALSYGKVWAYGTAVFLFSLFFLASGQYIYCKYINSNYLPMLYDIAIESFKSMGISGDFIAEMERQPVPTPVQYALSMSFINMIIGCLLSAATAFWACKVYKVKSS